MSTVTAEQYDGWTEEQCADVEIVGGVVVARPSRSARHNRIARLVANALDDAGGADWNADCGFDLRLRDVPLDNRCPDVVVYRADTVEEMPARPEHVLLLVEVVSPGSETTDRLVKPDQYAKAGIPFYWRVEQAAGRVPVVHTCPLDEASRVYRAGEVFTGLVKAAVPFPVEVDLTDLP
ncbi:Uma2 family endonuclease [Kitasatospora sp. NPDC059088]|uniref:Uma2 family endonuclease n=1 Tax=Kitasatospora sp. NPDC059088 TaxID=3346722 RepID=UPI0036D07C12